MMGMATCEVCGRNFSLQIDGHYIARDLKKTGVLPAVSGQWEEEIFDAFDCPHCGSQMIMKERKRYACPCDFGICDECDPEEENENTEEEEIAEHDGCEGCAYADVHETKYPCTECRNNYAELWTKGDE